MQNKLTDDIIVTTKKVRQSLSDKGLPHFCITTKNWAGETIVREDKGRRMRAIL